MNELEKELSEMDSFDAVKFILNDITLDSLQCIDIMKMLASKHALISYATGLGKTILSAAVMRLLWNEDNNRRFIFFGKFAQMSQTPEKLEKYCGKKVIASFATEQSIKTLIADRFTDYDVLFLTHHVLYNEAFMNWLFRNRSRYCGIFVDEAHELGNVNNTKAANILAGMSNQFEYFYAMTATPITTSTDQLAKLANMVDSKRYPSIATLKHKLNRGSFSIEDDPCFFINRTRADFGSETDYKGIVEWVNPLPHQKKECGGSQLFQLCKGAGAFPQAKALVRLIAERKGKRGLVYINQHSVRAWVLPFLDDAGIRYACVNGETKLKERTDIMRKFNEEDAYDVVITSVTEALDLDCDYVIFYEFTVDVEQMIGRAHRGLGNKSLDVIFVVTLDSGEIDYFYNNIFEISMTIKNLLRRDYSELEQVNEEIKNVKV